MQDEVLICNNSHSKFITKEDPKTPMLTVYSTKAITKKNFKATLYYKTYKLIEILENNHRTAANNISNA
ncbi:hypothetical protein G9A89_009747 [Geosiphon pyriformis]|nr:hypothetical protein G9A89_009747 [Geosiphon pyriformis]